MSDTSSSSARNEGSASAAGGAAADAGGTGGAATVSAGRTEPPRSPPPPPPSNRRGPGFLILALNLCLLAAACWFVWDRYQAASVGGPADGDGEGGAYVGPDGRSPSGTAGGEGASGGFKIRPSRRWGAAGDSTMGSAAHGTDAVRVLDYDPQTLERLGETDRILGTLGVELEVVRAIRGDYPSSADGQGANRGIESVVAALLSTRRMPAGLATADTDGDGADELVDPWGRALVYFSAEDYGSSQEIGGGSVSASTPRSALTGSFHAPERFQMWSLGPDGKNDGGLGDDIRSWIIHE